MRIGRLPYLPIAKTILPQTLLYAVGSIVAMSLHVAFHEPATWGLPEFLHHVGRSWVMFRDTGLPFGAISAFGSALAIFLAFRNNSGYDRWWEARKIWGALVNDSRSFARQVVSWVHVDDVPRDVDPDTVEAVRKELVHRHLAFVHGLGMHLRQQPDLLDRIAHFLPEGERDHYEHVPNVITALLIRQGQRIAELRRQGLVEHFRHLQMDELLTRFSDIQGKCERIKNTPVPRQYDEFPRVFVLVYGLLLPFGLVGSLGWMAVPVSTVIAVLFALLEVSGRVIEAPFENNPTDTPMTSLSITIERDLRSALQERDLPPPYKPEMSGRSGVVM